MYGASRDHISRHAGGDRRSGVLRSSSLEELDLPPNLLVIDYEAFAYCTSLKRIVVPPKLSLMAIDRVRFHNVTALEQIVFEDGREQSKDMLSLIPQLMLR